MRIRLLLADAFTILLGLFGYYAALSVMAVKCECGGSNYMLAAGLFLPACAFLLPSAHARMMSLTYRLPARVLFLSAAMTWSFLCYVTLSKFHHVDVPLPGWGELSPYFALLWVLMVALLVINYLFPGAAYDLVREERAEASRLNDEMAMAASDDSTRNGSEGVGPKSKVKAVKSVSNNVVFLLLIAPGLFFFVGRWLAPVIPSEDVVYLWQRYVSVIFCIGAVVAAFLSMRLRYEDQFGRSARPTLWLRIGKYFMSPVLGFVFSLGVLFGPATVANQFLKGEDLIARYEVSGTDDSARCKNEVQLRIAEDGHLWDSYDFCNVPEALHRSLAAGDVVEVTGKQTWFGHSIEGVSRVQL